MLLAHRTAIHSMIGYWHHPVVRLSVCLSVCDAVHRGSQGWRTMQLVPSRHVPICPFRHFCCSVGCIV